MSSEHPDGVIAWFAHNPVAANLLMLIILAVGLGSAFNIQRAMFPTLEIEAIFITAPYPGAAPEEVEQGVVLKIEEAINDLDGIKRVESDAFESFARIWIEPNDGYDLPQTAEPRSRTASTPYSEFPEEAEKPVIRQPEVLFPALTCNCRVISTSAV